MTEVSLAPAPSPHLPAVPRFDAILYPHRSLPPLGFAVLMSAVVAVSAAIGAGFVLIGAWPVTGFFGLDVLLLFLAFRWNYRQARRAEVVRLDHEGLVVRRIEPDGRQREWRFEPYWVRVGFDDPPRYDSQLTLSSHGRHLVLGAFLTVAERLEVARALEVALQAHRAARGD
jgi:uncharacterized membrane protein